MNTPVVLLKITIQHLLQLTSQTLTFQIPLPAKPALEHRRLCPRPSVLEPPRPAEGRGGDGVGVAPHVRLEVVLGAVRLAADQALVAEQLRRFVV